MSSEDVYSLFWKETSLLSSKTLHCTNISEKIIQNKEQPASTHKKCRNTRGTWRTVSQQPLEDENKTGARLSSVQMPDCPLMSCMTLDMSQFLWASFVMCKIDIVESTKVVIDWINSICMILSIRVLVPCKSSLSGHHHHYYKFPAVQTP